nr:hypothetical protein [Tanacetum cinerariifolium]
RARIAQSFALPTIADEPVSPVRDVSEGEACPTASGFIADQDRATIAKSSALPHDSSLRVTSPAADEGSMQQNISELTTLCTSLQRQYSELMSKFQAQEEEIGRLKEWVQALEDREGVASKQSGEDAPIKGRSNNEGEAAAERISNDSEEIARGEGSGTPTEPHHTPFPEVESSHPTTSSIPLPSIPTSPIPTVTQPDTTPIIQYSRRARIAQSSALPTVADEPASPVRDVSEGEACPTASGFIADQDRATIAKSSALPHDSSLRVTSPAADEGSMQQNISELTALCTSLQRQYSKLMSKFQAQEEEIGRLKERVQALEDIEGVASKQSGEDAPIKRRSNNEGEAAAERISNDSEEIARVLTSMDAATVLAGEIDVPTGSGFIPTAGPPATVISTSNEVGLTTSLIVTRRKGKEVMVESDTPKKKKLQEHIDAQKSTSLTILTINWVSTLRIILRRFLKQVGCFIKITNDPIPETPIRTTIVRSDRPTICYNDDDDDEDCTIVITPMLSTKEPDNSLSMGDEHLDTILATESDEFIKSSVENLVPILSESEGVPDNMYDVPFHDNSSPLDVSKDQFKDFSDSNDDSTSIDDDSFSIDNIEYVEASRPDSELISSEVIEIVIPKVRGIDDDILLTIKDDILREKLLNNNLLIANIKALKDNPTPSFDFMTKSCLPLLLLTFSWRRLTPLIILYPNLKLSDLIWKRLVVAVPLLF